MAFINKEKDYSIAIDSISDQHNILIGMINDFSRNVEKKADNELISNLINKIKNYAILHFSTEENIFKKYNFPDFEIHKKEHDNFIDLIVILEKKFHEGKVTISIDLSNILKRWFVNHLKRTENDFSNFLIEIDEK